jgi:hypothetical protein
VVGRSDDGSVNATLRFLDGCASFAVLSDGPALDESSANASEFRFFFFLRRADREIGYME